MKIGRNEVTKERKRVEEGKREEEIQKLKRGRMQEGRKD